MRTVYVMPVVNNRKRADASINADIADDVPDEAIGQIIGDQLRYLRNYCSAIVGEDIITLEVKIC